MELDVTTRGIIKLFLLPPGLLLLLMLIGWLFARRVFGRILLLVGIGLFYGLSTPAGLDWLARELETIPAATVDELSAARADAILVFMADVRKNNPELDGADTLAASSLERVDHALYLHRRTNLPIILSGGSVKGDSLPLAELGAIWLRDRAGVEVIAIDNLSKDTWENAQRSADILRTKGLHRVLLVTHAYHMPRALFSSRAANIDSVPAPFGFLHRVAPYREPDQWTDWLPHPGNLGRSYKVLHEMAGLVWYGFNRS